MVSFVNKLENGVLQSMEGQQLETDCKKTNAIIMIGSMKYCVPVRDCDFNSNAYNADNDASLVDISMVDVGSLYRNITTVSILLELIET